MNILNFSDLQCHSYQQFATRTERGLNSRFQDCLNIIGQVEKVVEERNVEIVFFTGDLFESRTKLDVDVYTETWKGIKRLAERVPVILLCGNHDQHIKLGDIHSLEPFKPFCHVVDSPSLFTVKGIEVAAYPFTTNITELKEWLRNLPNCDVLLLHQAVSEASLGCWDRSIKGELDVADIPVDRIKLCIAGHIHKRQTLGNGKIHLPGSPLPLNFGEVGEEKGITLIDTRTWEIETIPTDAPRFYKFTATKNDPDPLSLNLTHIDLDRDFVRVCYEEHWETSVLQLKERHPRIQLEQLSETRSGPEEVSETAINNDFLLLREYIEKSGAAGLDGDHLLELALQALEE